jgi:hypothetical protein
VGIHSVPVADTIAAIDKLTQMPPLWAQYRAAVDLLNRTEREIFLNYVDLGWLFARRGKTESLDARTTLSEDDVSLLRTALEWEYRRPCGFAMHLVEQFTTEERGAFLARESAAGYVITLGHVRQILPLVSQHRREFLELFYQRSPTLAQICRLILKNTPHCKAPSRKAEETEAQFLAQFDLDDDEPEDVAARREIEDRPDLLARYREAIERSNQIFSARVRQRIELGRIGLAVKTDSSLRAGPRGQVRAASAVKLLAAALGMHYATFKESLKLVETFAAADLEMFCARKSDKDLPITVEHLRWIALIGLPDTCNKLIELFYCKSASCEYMWSSYKRYQQTVLAAKATAKAASALDEPPRPRKA